jgi:hypothetical protein
LDYAYGIYGTWNVKMAKLLHRIGAKSIKYDLEVEVHYLRISLPAGTLLKIRIKRGKDKVNETQLMRYSPSTKRVKFDYPLEFVITMYKKSNKFSKKDLSIKIIELSGREERIIGTANIEFHKIAETGKQIDFEELALSDCSDPNAKLCMSVHLFEAAKNKKNFMTGNTRKTMHSANRRAMSIDGEDTRGFIEDEISRFDSTGRSDTVSEKSISLLIPGNNEPEEDFKAEKPRKPSIRSMKAAICISAEMMDELGAVEDKSDLIDVEQEVEEEGKFYKEKLEQIQTIRDSCEFKLEIKDDSQKSADLVYDSPYKNESNNLETEEIDLRHTDEKKDEESTRLEVDHKVIEQEKNESEYEASRKDDPEKSPEIKLPGFLKVENYALSNRKSSISKSVEDSSSSEEVPEQVDFSDSETAMGPVVNMKGSAPNAGSKEMQITLKEREAGLPESRNATCCASCRII